MDFCPGAPAPASSTYRRALGLCLLILFPFWLDGTRPEVPVYRRSVRMKIRLESRIPTNLQGLVGSRDVATSIGTSMRRTEYRPLH